MLAWTLALCVLFSLTSTPLQLFAQSPISTKRVQLPTITDENDPFHPTFGRRQYNKRLPASFIQRATSAEARNAIAALTDQQRKAYMENFNRILQGEVDKYQRSPVMLKPVGGKDILAGKVKELVTDLTSVAILNPRGQREVVQVNYQEGQVPADAPKQISRLTAPANNQRLGGLISSSQLSKNLFDEKVTRNEPFRRSQLSYSKSAIGFSPKLLQSGDNDADGLDDSFENTVADYFTPVYLVSNNEADSFCTFANYTPQTVGTLYGQYPLSYFRVTPYGFITDIYGQQYSALRIDYLTLWNHDGGMVGGGGACAYNLLGINSLINQLSDHVIDNERSATLLLAPVTTPNTYNSDPSAYASYAYFMAAHEGTFTDKSTVFYPPTPWAAGTHIIFALALSKHGTYTFNPNYLPLLHPIILASAIAGIEFSYYMGWISYIEYLIYLGLAYDTYYACVVERFLEPQYGYIADPRINVGEVNTPINSCAFIQDNSEGLRSKLENGLPW